MTTRKLKPPLYLLGWPAWVGGSEADACATAELLAGVFDVVWVPNAGAALAERSARGWLASRGMRAARWGDLPRRLAGVGLAMCNIPFLTEGRAAVAAGRGDDVADPGGWGRRRDRRDDRQSPATSRS